MSNQDGDDEKTSLLGSLSGGNRKNYSLQDSLNPIFTNSGSSDVPNFRSIEISQRTEPITYAWSNINVWVGANGNGNGNGNGKENGQKGSSPIAKVPDKDKWFWQRGKNGAVSKQILNNVSGVVRPGELLAIMGASGAGKTTLLNVMTFRSNGKLRVSGERSINGVPVGPDILTSLSAYVQQDDLFIGTLTVREHLIFQALVRMHRHIPYKQRMRRVEEVIQELGLTKCADTLIGVAGRLKGISGGEMKRLAFASEVLTDPPIMFCDEPTSGLDSYMAQNIVEVLKSMAQKGKTIICTIHQPSSEVYAMFDRILLMAEGRIAFLGNARDAVGFFKEQGFECPTNFNPADYFIQTLAIQPGSEETCREAVQKICDSFEASKEAKEIQSLLHANYGESSELLLMEASLKNRSPYKASWWAQFRAVLWRSWLSLVKEPMVLNVRILQTFIVSILMGIIYFGQELNQDGVMNINGALFLFLTNMTFQNVFAVVNVFCQELPIFLREHFNGMYRTDVYFLAKTLAELPLYIFFPIIFTSVCYYMVGLNPEFERFLVTCAIAVLVSNVSCSFGYMVSCISSSVTMALSMAPPFIIPFMLFGGFYLNKASVPVYFVWLRYLSWFNYGNEALAINQWENIDHIDCNRSNTTCPPNGAVVLETLDFQKENLVFDVVMLGFLIVFYRTIAFLALLKKTYRK